VVFIVPQEVRVKAIRSDARVTREALIKAAECLFAEQGIESVSLMEITRMAGQKNRSALLYHFGNRETLLEAVLKRHADEIGQVRFRMLAALNENSGLRDVVEAIVLPLAVKLDDDSGINYLRISAQMFSSKEMHSFRFHTDRTRRSDALMQALLPRVPAMQPLQAKMRMQLVGSFLFHSLADQACLQSELSEWQKKQQNRFFIQYLVDSLVAILSVAPRMVAGGKDA
jgi:AcrR family transcriptional regulator